MGNNTKCDFIGVGIIGILLSILFGIAIGILFLLGLISAIVILAWVAFGLGILTLIVLIVAVFLAAITRPNALSKCFSRNITCLIVGIVGTIISALAIISIVIGIVIIEAIIVGIGAFFFLLMILSLISFILCIVCNISIRCKE